MATAGVLGFVGLGVMGESMCRNLARKSGATMVAFDERPAPLAALAADGVQAAASAAEVARRAEIVFLCLPGEPQVRAVCLGAGGGLAARVEPGQTVVDMSTCPVGLARELHQAFGARGAAFADAPIARTAQAARDGTLSIMVGGDPALFARLRPFLGCMGSEVTHRNHGMKSLLPDHHPTEGAFPTRYILKDLSYAIQLAESAGVALEQAATTRRLLEATAAAGWTEAYYTAVIRTIEKPGRAGPTR